MVPRPGAHHALQGIQLSGVIRHPRARTAVFGSPVQTENHGCAPAHVRAIGTGHRYVTAVLAATKQTALTRRPSELAANRRPPPCPSLFCLKAVFRGTIARPPAPGRYKASARCVRRRPPPPPPPLRAVSWCVLEWLGAKPVIGLRDACLGRV